MKKSGNEAKGPEDPLKIFRIEQEKKISRKEEIKRLRESGMSQEKIILVLWNAMPEEKKKYEDAVAEFEELLKE